MVGVHFGLAKLIDIVFYSKCSILLDNEIVSNLDYLEYGILRENVMTQIDHIAPLKN